MWAIFLFHCLIYSKWEDEIKHDFRLHLLYQPIYFVVYTSKILSDRDSVYFIFNERLTNKLTRIFRLIYI